MADSDGGNWITVNGTHIFVKDGETVEQAIDRSFSSNRDKLAATLGRHSEFNSGRNSKSNSGITLSKQEYAVLRNEVMRKNSSQKGKIKTINCAYTANHFYVYHTKGGDSFTAIKQLSLDEDRDKINFWLKIVGD